jgi:hypothetical protein
MHANQWEQLGSDVFSTCHWKQHGMFAGQECEASPRGQHLEKGSVGNIVNDSRLVVESGGSVTPLATLRNFLNIMHHKHTIHHVKTFCLHACMDTPHTRTHTSGEVSHHINTVYFCCELITESERERLFTRICSARKGGVVRSADLHMRKVRRQCVRVRGHHQPRQHLLLFHSVLHSATHPEVSC